MRWLSDENLNNDILRAIFRRRPTLDMVRVQDVGLVGQDDALVLAYAAESNRVLLSHDVTTLTDHAYQRILRSDPMPGLFEIASTVAIGTIVEDLLLIEDCSFKGEWNGQVVYLPLRR